MPTTYVAVDVETTGLDSDRDAIIEVAAITFRGPDVLDEFSSLTNPQRDIPGFITQLTGISQAMVDDAPSMFTLRSRLRAIIGDNVIVGHNVEFDLGFLNAERLGVGNHRIDTVTLASILFPEAGRFSLDALARHLNLPDAAAGQNHRAYDDALQTVELFLALREKALTLEIVQLEEIVQAGSQLGWPETLFFEDVLAEKAKHAFTGKRSGQRLARLFNPDKLTGKILAPADKMRQLDGELIAGMLQPGGNFERVFDGFEHRPQQVEMLTAVIQAFNHGDHVLVEAGTGTGKSVAYLLPAAFWAHENGRRVVVSTNTINLQDQLIHKDVPDLQKTLPFEIRAAVRKGRSNYLCTRLFQQMRHSGPSSADEMVLFARILLWLPHTKTGDVAEVALRTPGERLAWSRLNGENATCTGDQCAQENCPLHVARRRAEQAHIVIVNHALLLSDVSTGSLILPEFTDLIIDEAHHLESAVTDGLSFRADKRFLEAILDDITAARSGLIADVHNRARSSLPPAMSSTFDQIVNRLRRDAQVATQELEEFFTTLSFFLQDFTQARSQFAEQIRLVPAVRAQPNYDEVEMSWANLDKSLRVIVKGFEQLAQALSEVVDGYDFEDSEELLLTVQSNGRSLHETRQNLNGIIAEPENEMIYWVEVWKDRISLHAAPLHIGPLVEKHIFQAKETVILTSATMRTAGPQARGEPTFDYIKERLHGQDANELAVGSPFDYENANLLYLVTDIPEPNQPGYQRYLEEAIIDVAKALNGRTLVLFTAYGHLTQTARAVEGPLGAAGITVLAQTQGASRQQLLAQFKQEDSKSVLLGTRSFWEGVDVPGDALQAVLIAKIPFDVPSDPIFAARSETYDNAFFEYSVPEAVLRFRQGFGRLIRRQSDEGVVVILDKRVLTKRYGQMFLDSLPNCTVLRQRNGRLGELTLRWLNRDK
ncbi:MAG: DEAD/DEAH box helicase family protein [Ardenticatenaceae bacterium]|nr:DEAD/DEAH box helicase family protein [Ardenticatenaceae bacterium]MCB9446507.1 DEAD/DEAH box helicase family protein [Ardenticatenaceae bacterium]